MKLYLCKHLWSCVKRLQAFGLNQISEFKLATIVNLINPSQFALAFFKFGHPTVGDNSPNVDDIPRLRPVFKRRAVIVVKTDDLGLPFGVEFFKGKSMVTVSVFNKNQRSGFVTGLLGLFINHQQVPGQIIAFFDTIFVLFAHCIDKSLAPQAIVFSFFRQKL